MITNVTLSLITEPRTVTFDGMDHKAQDIFVHAGMGTDINNPQAPEPWTTVLTLWDEDIERFKALGLAVDSAFQIDIIPGYRRDRNRPDVCYKDLKTRMVWTSN